ncbi:helix-turn-helix domain-containing protein [Brevibacillus porteri]|uniref:helix-turn-helix domain-containing protein n=1 Tax=Brevibacillus porteri TaxID=2126350 RepID=UPI003D24DD7F
MVKVDGLHERLRLARKASDLTQAKVAEFLNTNKSTIARYESGTREPDAATLLQLADIYNVNILHLLNGFPVDTQLMIDLENPGGDFILKTEEDILNEIRNHNILREIASDHVSELLESLTISQLSDVQQLDEEDLELLIEIKDSIELQDIVKTIVKLFSRGDSLEDLLRKIQED